MSLPLLLLALALPGPLPPVTPAILGDAANVGYSVQRTMRLLATSTPEKQNAVRVLFYGQSITEQKWAEIVAADLRRRFPHADLTIENRALGGFSSQRLVKTVLTDVEPFAPDLVVFHVYGSHVEYEGVIRTMRERTGAEVLMQTDHVTKPKDLGEETDSAKLPPRGDQWDAFMNHNWLPAVAKKYGCGLLDQRAVWKRYLAAYDLQPKDLLRDGVHLNAHGEYLMAECVKAALVYDPKAKPAADGSFTTLPVPAGGELTFDGTRADLVFQPGSKGSVAVAVDGKKPSETPAAYRFTRALPTPGGKWPAVAGMTPAGQPVAEAWTLTLTRDPANAKRFTFTLAGSVTGPDGGGSTAEPFTSKSGRVKINPEQWDLEFALMLAGVKPVPDRLTVTFRTELLGADAATAARPLAVGGLANGGHTLALTGDLSAVAGVRVTRPPLGRAK